jgi:hypothetical protein
MGTVLALVAWVTTLGLTSDTMLVEQSRFGQFIDAVRIESIGADDLLVVDAGSNEVVWLSGKGEVVRRFGGYGWTPGSFDRPSGVASDGLNIFVSDWGNHRIQRFERNGTFVSSLSTRDTSFEAAQFGHPCGVAVTRFGDLLVLDEENERIAKFVHGTAFDNSFAAAQPTRGYRDLVDIETTPGGQILLLERGTLSILDEFGSPVRSVAHLWLDGARGVGSSERVAVAVCDSGLIIVPLDEQLMQSIPVSRIFFASQPGLLRDVILKGRTLFLLTQHEVIVLNGGL